MSLNRFFSNSALVKMVFAIASAVASVSAFAQAQTYGTFVFLPLQVTGGVADNWIINTATGTVSYCSARTLTNTSSPIGSCSVIGNVGKSTSGYFFPGYMGSTTLSNLQIVSKTSGAIFQCGVVIAANPAKPTGKCMQKSSTSLLQ